MDLITAKNVPKTRLRFIVGFAIVSLVMQPVYAVVAGHSVGAMAAPQTNVVVRSSDFATTASAWTYYDNSAGIASPVATDTRLITSKPGGTVNDSAAVRVMSGEEGRWNLATLQYSGLRLADIEALGFEVYTTIPDGLSLALDVNLTSPEGDQRGRLEYVSDNNGVSMWQSYEVIGSGQWRWSWAASDQVDMWPDGYTGMYRSWADIVEAFPEAVITVTEDDDFIGGLYLGVNGDGTVYYDHVYLATSEHHVQYNFESDLPVVDDDKDDIYRNPEVPVIEETEEDDMDENNLITFLPSTISSFGSGGGSALLSRPAITLGTDAEGKDVRGVAESDDASTSWSVVNAALAGFIAVLALVAVVGVRRQDADNNTGTRLFMIIPAVIAGAVFLTAENTAGQMIWLNGWTWLFLGILVVQAIVATLTTKTAND